MNKYQIQPLGFPSSSPIRDIIDYQKTSERRQDWPTMWQPPSPNPISFRKSQKIKAKNSLTPGVVPDVFIKAVQTYGCHILHTEADIDGGKIISTDDEDDSNRVTYSDGPYTNTKKINIPHASKFKTCNNRMVSRINTEYTMGSFPIRNMLENTWVNGFGLVSKNNTTEGKERRVRSVAHRTFFNDNNVTKYNIFDSNLGFDAIPGETSINMEHGFYMAPNDYRSPEDPVLYNIWTLIPRFYQGFLMMTQNTPNVLNPSGYSQVNQGTCGVFNFSCADLFSFGSVYAYYEYNQEMQRTTLTIPSDTFETNQYEINPNLMESNTYIGHYLVGTSGSLTAGGRVPFRNIVYIPQKIFSVDKTLDVPRRATISNDVTLPFSDFDSPKCTYSIGASYYDDLTDPLNPDEMLTDKLFVLEISKTLYQSYFTAEAVNNKPKLIQSTYEYLIKQSTRQYEL